MTNDRFLNDIDAAKKKEVLELSAGFPMEIFESYKMIKRTDKMKTI